jgi:alanine racemase
MRSYSVPSRVVVDLDALRDNVVALRDACAPGAALMAVVKADAYGHGLLPVARAALAAGATWLGVAHLESALTLRDAGIDAPVLAWLHVPSSHGELVEAVGAGVDLAAGSSEMVGRLAAAAREAGTTARVHLKIDTGMARNGVLPGDAAELARLAGATGVLDVVGAWSHLAVADEPDDPFTTEQHDLLTGAVADIEAALGRPLEVVHLANSAALLTRPDTHHDLVRAGIALYGYPPVPGGPELRPVLGLETEVALVKDVPAGTTVGYGRTRTLDAPTRLALVPAGYADGLPRAASDRLTLRIATAAGDVLARQVGRICMDQLVVALPAGADVRPGDVAHVIDRDPTAGGSTAEQWAEAAGTISYEILTSVTARIPRTHLGEGDPR